MLRNVNNLIPNNLSQILSDKKLTIADCVRLTGLTRPTVKKLVDGEDSYISKMKVLADGIGITLGSVYNNSTVTVSQNASSYGHSSMSAIGMQIVERAENAEMTLHQRINDLENLVSTQRDLLEAKDEIIATLRKKD